MDSLSDAAVFVLAFAVDIYFQLYCIFLAYRFYLFFLFAHLEHLFVLHITFLLTVAYLSFYFTEALSNRKVRRHYSGVWALI